MTLFNIKNILWHFSKKLASLSFSIFILFLICILSMLGSFIEQNQSMLYYKINYPINKNHILYIDWRVITNLGLDHVYETWWFNLILMIFAFSLVICTFSTQLPSLKNARRWKFINSKTKLNFSNNDISSSCLFSNSAINMIYSLTYCNFYVFHKKNQLYAYKGILGRIAPVFVHFSMIVTLIGTIFSLFFSFVAQEIIPNGEIFHLKNIVNAGLYSKLPRHFIGRIDNFSIDYNLDNSIKQFFSKISIFDATGDFIHDKIISVNSPLLFRGITFYQTDWKINALRIKLGSNLFIQKKLLKMDINNKVVWLCNLPLTINKNILFLIFNLEDKVFIYDMNGFLVYTLSINHQIYINNIAITIKDIMTSTGLQIKIDPGVFIVYLGFFILMLSSIISYISYSQIWVSLVFNTFNLTGSTNRAVLLFEEDIAKITQIYMKYSTTKNILFTNMACNVLRK